MKYLVEHHETFYYRRKIHYQTLCVSLKTKNKCKFHFYVSSHFTFMFPPISLKVSTWKQGVK